MFANFPKKNIFACFLLGEYGDFLVLLVFDLNLACFKFREKREINNDGKITTYTVPP